MIGEGPIRIMGWVTHIRSSGKLIFVEVRDGTGVIQCVIFKGDVVEQIFDMAKGLTLESSLIVDGIIRRDSRSKMGYEIGVTHIEPFQIPSEEFPISPK